MGVLARAFRQAVLGLVPMIGAPDEIEEGRPGRDRHHEVIRKEQRQEWPKAEELAPLHSKQGEP